MKKFLLIIALTLTGLLQAVGQSPIEVVYLKNGSVIRGTIIEQIPNKSIKIQTADGSIFVYPMDEVTKITKEHVTTNNNQQGTHGYFAKDYGLHKGYKGFLELGGGIGVGDNEGDSFFNATTSHGYQASPYFFIGAGVGFTYMCGTAYLPVFADVRIHLLKGNISPFFGAKVGYSIIEDGAYMSPSFGARFGILESFALNLTFNYLFQTDGPRFDWLNHGVGLKLGFEF